MKQPSLWHQAEQFRKRVASIKSGLCPLGGGWYPYASCSSLQILDQFLAGDAQALLKMIGVNPVLDLGCGDGDVAFFLESLGASVHAVDHAPTNHNGMTGVQAMKQALISSIEIRAADLDQPLELPAAQFSLTILLGVLYHLKNPYAILETLAKTTRYCFLSTRIAALTPDKKTRLSEIPMAYLLEEGETNRDSTNYWIFTEAGLRRILKRSGWTVVHYVTTGDAAGSDPVSQAGDARAFCLLRSRLADLPAEATLLAGWHEVEFGAWRWTSRRFSLALCAPQDGESATLRFRFHLPPPIFAQRSTVCLNAAVNGTILENQVYTSPGDHQFIRTIPAEWLRPEMAHFDFELDGALEPTLTDRRELGVLVDFSKGSPITLH